MTAQQDTQFNEGLAIEALQYLASEDDLLMRFSALSGILPNDMREASAQPGFLAGVLDFFLSHEPDLLTFCGQSGHSPEAVVSARHKLAPNDSAGFE